MQSLILALKSLGRREEQLEHRISFLCEKHNDLINAQQYYVKHHTASFILQKKKQTTIEDSHDYDFQCLRHLFFFSAAFLIDVLLIIQCHIGFKYTKW